VTAPDLASAYVIAEFMLNLVPLPNPPARSAVEAYLGQHFARPEGGFRFSCHQDFVVIRPRREPIAPQGGKGTGAAPEANQT
jgi:hypothetical protein